MENSQSSGAQRKSKVNIENASSEANASQTAPQSQSSSSSSSGSENDDNDAVPEDAAAAATTTKPTRDDMKQFKFLIKNIQIFNVKSFDTTNTSDPYLKITLGGNFKIEDERH
ncbi:MAG: hypothetical protein EZS28_048699, partial [Streblomastix strix]